MNTNLLTKREIEVLKYFAVNIASACKSLNISITTFKTHKNNIYQKFDTHSTVETLIKALKNKIIKLEDIA